MLDIKGKLISILVFLVVLAVLLPIWMYLTEVLDYYMPYGFP